MEREQNLDTGVSICEDEAICTKLLSLLRHDLLKTIVFHEYEYLRPIVML